MALEARGRADEYVRAGASLWLARAWATLRAAKRARPRPGDESVVDSEDHLALEHVEGFVEVVRVQRGAGAVRRDHDSVTDRWPPAPRCAAGRWW